MFVSTASCRSILASRSYIPNILIPNQNQTYGTYLQLHTSPQNRCESKNPPEIDKLSVGNICDTVGDAPQTTGPAVPTESYYGVKFSHKWKGKVLLITGASRGLGSHILRKALEEGVKRVTNVDIDCVGGLKQECELKNKFSAEKMYFIKCNVANTDKLKQTFEIALRNKDESHVVINNATLMNDSMHKYKEQIDINVAALVNGSLTALEMMRRDRGGKGGTIINISSVAALCPLPFTPIYNATKSAVLTFSMGLGNEEYYYKTGVRVIAVCVGGTVDEVVEKYPVALQAYPGQSAESAAQAVIDAYKSAESGSIWLANADKPAKNITPAVKCAYKILTETILT